MKKSYNFFTKSRTPHTASYCVESATMNRFGHFLLLGFLAGCVNKTQQKREDTTTKTLVSKASINNSPLYLWSSPAPGQPNMHCWYYKEALKGMSHEQALETSQRLTERYLEDNDVMELLTKSYNSQKSAAFRNAAWAAGSCGAAAISLGVEFAALLKDGHKPSWPAAVAALLAGPGCAIYGKDLLSSAQSTRYFANAVHPEIFKDTDASGPDKEMEESVIRGLVQSIKDTQMSQNADKCPTAADVLETNSAK